MAKHPVPKKRQAKSRTRTRYSVYKRKRQNKLLNMVQKVKDIKRRSQRVTSVVAKRGKKVTTIKA